MPGTQGLRPADAPYRLLQIDPSAPPALVSEVYAALVKRASARGSGADTSTTYLEQLHAAYAAVLSDRREADVLGRGCSSQSASYYAVLAVDEDADIGVIRLAYDVAKCSMPLPANSIGDNRRREALRILSDPALRQLYDEGRKRGILRASPRPDPHESPLSEPIPREGIALSVQPTPESSPPNQPQESLPKAGKKRGFLGLRGKSEPALDARDERLLALRTTLPVARDETDLYIDTSPEPEAAAAAELVFTHGPREGLRVELNGNVVPLGQGKASATVWRHGDRFMLRHNGNEVRVGGSLPLLPILVLEDGDDIAVGTDRAMFRIVGQPLP